MNNKTTLCLNIVCICEMVIIHTSNLYIVFMYTNIFFKKSLIVILQLNENIIILMQINAIIK
jgi:hypothetical protein